MGSPPVLGQTFCMSFTDSKELSLRNETNFYLLHYSFASILRKSGTVTAFVSSLGSPKIPGILSHVAPLPLTFIMLSVLTCITCASAYISQLSKVQSCLLSLAVVRSLWRPDSVARDISQHQELYMYNRAQVGLPSRRRLTAYIGAHGLVFRRRRSMRIAGRQAERSGSPPDVRQVAYRRRLSSEQPR